ncbi:MAG: hypothetical protein RML36_01025 [Anaerolineae bacterium]|nr:hypothetical protein [Anaerolineae bacterium]MDW8098050.1 hypothetical protein [Anaerolineae bacterium]
MVRAGVLCRAGHVDRHGTSVVSIHFGAAPQVGWRLYGVKLVIIAVIAQALWELSRKAVQRPLKALIGLAVFALWLSPCQLGNPWILRLRSSPWTGGMLDA